MTGKFYLEVRENGIRIPTGDRQGYKSAEEAAAKAKQFVDDALPRNTVHVLQDVGHAYLAGDGEAEYLTHV